MSIAARAGEGLRTAPFGLLGDERLARLATAGHSRAFAIVYERHHQALYRYCRSILRNDADAQDALQSTFAAAFAALGRSRPDAPIRPWLFRIAHNEAVSALRRRRPTTDLSAASDWCTTSVEDQVAERVELDTLLRDLRDLNERQRSALVMRELSGLSHEDIAIALDTSVGAAKQTIYEARRSLFEFAEGRALACDEIRRTISDADGRLLRSRRVRAHLRECSGCAEFAAAIPERGRELRALAPALPAGMLEQIAGAGAAHGTGTGWAGLATGAAGKLAGTAVTANALAGVAVVASATVGVTIGMDKFAHASHHAGVGHFATPAVGARAAHARMPAPSLRVPATGPLIRPEAHPTSRTVRSVPGPRRGTAAAARHRIAQPSTAPGRRSSSAAALGFSSAVAGQTATPAPGRSAAAPGHSTTSSAPGHSSSAPGHATTTSTAPGHSGSSPGHTAGSSQSTPASDVPALTSTVPAGATPAPLPTVPPGAALSVTHQKH